MGFEYTVNSNDKGLSYIFLDQAKKLEGFDENKKIDWNQVMNVFDEIQKEKKADNESLFSGGTDKTKKGWGTSYTIKKDDKIQLTDGQLNKIYEAMGVDLKKAKRTPEEKVTPPAKDTKPPKKSEDYSNRTAELTDLEKADKKDIADGETEIDGKIVNYKDGYVTSVTDKKAKTSRIILRNDDGSIKGFNDYEDDENGFPLKLFSYDKDNKLIDVSEFENNENGKPTKTIIRKLDGTVDYYSEWTYDENNNTTKQVVRNADGTVKDFIEYEYDSKGRMTRKIFRDSNGEVQHYTEYTEWNPDTKVPTKEQVYSPDGHPFRENT